MLVLVVRRSISYPLSQLGSYWSMWPLQQLGPCTSVALMSVADEIIISSLPA